MKMRNKYLGFKFLSEKPFVHQNSHRHRWIDNPTGGSLIRDDPEPVAGWRYI